MVWWNYKKGHQQSIHLFNYTFNKLGKRGVFIYAILPATAAAIVLSILFGQQFQAKKSSTKIVDSLICWDDSLLKDSPVAAYQKIEMAKALVNENDHKTLGKIYSKEASFEKSIHQYKKALQCYNRAIKEYTYIKDKQKLADSYYRLGDVYKKIGEYNLGFKATVKGVNLYAKINDLQGVRRCYNNIGSFYKYLEDYSRALEYYQRALRISQDLKYESGISSAFNNLGTIYSAMNQLELALEFYRKSMETDSKSKSDISKAIYYGNVAGIYTKQKRFHEAYSMLVKAQHYLAREYEPRNLASHHIDFGEYYEGTNLIDSAILCYNRSLSLAYRYNFKEKIATAYLRLSSAYLKQNRYKEAMAAQTSYLLYREKLLNNQKSLEIARLENDFEASKSKMEKDNATLKLYLLLAVLIITIIAAVSTLLYIKKKYRNAVFKQKQIQQHLENEKTMVESNLSEKNRELALYSLQKIQQKEANEALAERLKTKFKGHNSEIREEIHSIVKELERENNHQQIWEEFEHRFISVNPGFYDKLLENFPDLTQNERRICAFLKLNMSTKEISAITGQSPHSINVARTRLRKKIGITNSSLSLSDLIVSI